MRTTWGEFNAPCLAIYSSYRLCRDVCCALLRCPAYRSPYDRSPDRVLRYRRSRCCQAKRFLCGNFWLEIDGANLVETPQLSGALRQDPSEKVLYIGVPDLDAAMKKVTDLGGEIVSPKIPISTGTFVLFKDPAGNRMGLVQLKR